MVINGESRKERGDYMPEKQENGRGRIEGNNPGLLATLGNPKEQDRRSKITSATFLGVRSYTMRTGIKGGDKSVKVLSYRPGKLSGMRGMSRTINNDRPFLFKLEGKRKKSRGE